MCFDKTGTLTEEGLDTHGVIIVDQQNTLSKLIKTIDQMGHRPNQVDDITYEAD